MNASSPCGDPNLSNVADFVDNGENACMFEVGFIRMLTQVSMAVHVVGYVALLAWFVSLRRSGQSVRMDVQLFVIHSVCSLVFGAFLLIKLNGIYEDVLVGQNSIMTILWSLGSLLISMSVDSFLQRYLAYLQHVAFIRSHGTSSNGEEGTHSAVGSLPARHAMSTSKLRLIFRIVCTTMSATNMFTLVPGINDTLVFKIFIAQGVFVVMFTTNVFLPYVLNKVKQDFETLLKSYDETTFMGLRIKRRLIFLNRFLLAMRCTGIGFLLTVAAARLYKGSFEGITPYYVLNGAALAPTSSLIMAYCFWPVPIDKLRRKTSIRGVAPAVFEQSDPVASSMESSK